MSERWTPAYDRLFGTEHDFGHDPACHRFAWLDICHMAQWRDGVRVVSGSVVELPRGTFLASVRFLAKRWGWSKNRVHRFLAVLQHPDIAKIETVTETRTGTVYRVVTYDAYANPRDTKRDSNGDTTGTQPGQRTTSTTSTTSTGRARRTKLPETWEPTEGHAQRASQARLDMGREVVKFRTHAEATGRKMERWNAAFTSWLMNAEEFAAKGNGRPPPRDTVEYIPGHEAVNW